jgi:hypothetical protein
MPEVESYLSVSFAVLSPSLRRPFAPENVPFNVQFLRLEPESLKLTLQLDSPLSSQEVSTASSPPSPLLRMYAQTSSYEALVTFSAGIPGTSFVWPSINGLLSSGVSECSALLPFSRHVLTAGTSA